MKIIGGKYKGQKLISPSNFSTRPTSSRLREAFFNICQNQIENASFLDLFAGSGAIGIEAISRGAKSVTFVESNRTAFHAIKSNLKKLEIKIGAKILLSDVFSAIKKLESHKTSFDIIWADPPYQEGLSYQLLLTLDEASILPKNGTLFIEEKGGALEEFDTSFQTLEITNFRSYGKSSLYTVKRKDRVIL